MNGTHLLAELAKHGGLARVHTRPVRASNGSRGWANTLVCHDGWKYTTTAREDHALVAAMEAVKVEPEGILS